VARDDNIDRQAGKHFQRFLGTGQAVGFTQQFGENDPEAVFPERVA
jgi:hypothetical protein